MLAEERLTREYPKVYVEQGLATWPEVSEGIEMDFKLTYKGKLPAASRGDTRSADKHRIRRYLHPQLKVLWETHPSLRHNMIPAEDGDRNVDRFARIFRKCDYDFMPLLDDSDPTLAGGILHMVCALDILFLRRDQPGNLIRHGGDVDNRIKVLFDALQIPENCNQIDAPLPGETPLFCLMSDDRLITEVKVTTDRLLTPKADDEGTHDVELVIGVRTSSPF